LADEIDLTAMRAQLTAISKRVGDGFLISCAWDGEVMRVSAGKVPGDRRPWVMTMDCESDYQIDHEWLIAEFASGVRQWFAGEAPIG
jgi:hypothetical protein